MEQVPKRILHVVSSMERGGAETLLMNIYRKLDRTKVQFDFLSHSNQIGDYEEEIINLGGRIFKVSSLGQLGPISYIKELVKIMKSNNFAAVHSHTDFQAGIPALAARIAGINRRICHSHSNNWPKGNQITEVVTFKVLQSIIRLFASHYCSCSYEAAQFLFGNRLVENGKVSIIKNGIDINEFTKYGIRCKDEIINEFGLPFNSKIIGHVGRFSESKNHSLILKVLKRLLDEDKSYFVLLIGDGPLRTQIEEEAKKLGISEHIRLLGIRTDIPRLMKAFDVFLFPSRFEGFGIVTIEAQSSGTPCVISDTVPKTTDMGLGLVTFVNLNESLDVWCSKVKEATNWERPKTNIIVENVSKKGYNIQNNLNDWFDLYGVSKMN